MGYELQQDAPEATPVMERTAFVQRITVTSDDPELYPPKALVFRQPPVGHAAPGPWFECVASLPDLMDYPEDAAPEPEEDDPYIRPYFRLAQMDVVTRSPSELAAFLDRVRLDLGRLEADIDALNSLTPP